MKTPTLKEVIEQVRAAAPGMEAIADSTSGRIELKFHGIDAQPEDIAAALREALPDWHDAQSSHGESCAWASINRHHAVVTVFAIRAQARDYIARQQDAA